jgi:hypothetical protein
VWLEARRFLSDRRPDVNVPVHEHDLTLVSRIRTLRCEFNEYRFVELRSGCGIRVAACGDEQTGAREHLPA